MPNITRNEFDTVAARVNILEQRVQDLMLDIQANRNAAGDAKRLAEENEDALRQARDIAFNGFRLARALVGGSDSAYWEQVKTYILPFAKAGARSFWKESEGLFDFGFDDREYLRSTIKRALQPYYDYEGVYQGLSDIDEAVDTVYYGLRQIDPADISYRY